MSIRVDKCTTFGIKKLSTHSLQLQPLLLFNKMNLCVILEAILTLPKKLSNNPEILTSLRCTCTMHSSFIVIVLVFTPVLVSTLLYYYQASQL